jgi:Putative porin
VSSIRHGTAALSLLALFAVAAPTSAEDNPALVEAFQIMRDKGLIDDAKHAELVAKNEAWETAHPSLLSRLEWSADFRGRFENFFYDEDDFGIDTQDRNRGRYRVRIGARAKVNEVVTAGFRVASGEGDHRSTNTTFGTQNDFGPDAIFIDQAYVELGVPKPLLAEGVTVKSIVGKQANPFLWKNGKDFMIWDQDITPEGVGLQVTGAPTEMLSLYGNAGYFIVDENGGAKDPHVLGVQGGFGLAPTDCFDFGFRATYYDWRSVNDAFLTRMSETGSLITDESDYSVVELASYGRITKFEGWPILVYGHVAQNVNADSIEGDEDLGWGAGVEVGDKKNFVMVGGGYYHLEANFSPAQFTDSDLFDGFTNREGWLFYVGREIFKNTELSLTFFSGEEIQDGANFDLSVVDPDVPSAERYRLQTDVVVKF